jgi:hypothetical protein
MKFFEEILTILCYYHKWSNFDMKRFGMQTVAFLGDEWSSAACAAAA